MRNRKSKTALHAQSDPGEIPPDWVRHVYCPEYACRRTRACRARNKKLSCKSRRKHVPESERDETFREMQKALKMKVTRWILELARRKAAGEPVEMPTNSEIHKILSREVYSEKRYFN